MLCGDPSAESAQTVALPLPWRHHGFPVANCQNHRREVSAKRTLSRFYAGERKHEFTCSSSGKTCVHGPHTACELPFAHSLRQPRISSRQGTTPGHGPCLGHPLINREQANYNPHTSLSHLWSRRHAQF